MKEKKALMLASVASMIDLFNMDNIDILMNLGYKIDVACNFEEGSITSEERVRQFKDELHSRGIITYQLPIPRSVSKVKSIVSSYKIIKKLVDKNDYAIVHCHSPIGGVVCRLACRDTRRKKNTKVIYTAHGFHFFKGASLKAWMFFFPIEKWCSKYTDVLITINKEDYYRAKKFKAKQVKYVPGIGVHTDEIKNLKIDREEKRKEFGFSNSDYIFMSTGQLSIRKNHEIIIRALAKTENENIKYLIVGFGEEEEHLRKLARELDLDKRVVFAGYRGDVKELLHAVDGFVFPSLQEGLPVSLMEAMAAGLPILCSKIRGNEDLIENGKGGFLFNPYDVDGFARGMEMLSTGRYDEMKKINITMVEKFDINSVNAIMFNIYNSAKGV